MSVIDVGLRFSQCRLMVTHDEILAELIKRLDAKTVTGRAIAELLRIAPARVTEMKNGKRQIQQDEMPVLAELFGMDAPETSNLATNVVWVPIIGIAAAGAWQEAIELPAFLSPQVKMPGTNQAFGVVVSGDSMDNVMQPGSYAIIDPDQRVRLESKRVYLIQNGGGETTIKRYMDSPPRFEPDSRNPEHKPIYVGEHEIRVIGRVVSVHSVEGL